MRRPKGWMMRCRNGWCLLLCMGLQRQTFCLPVVHLCIQSQTTRGRYTRSTSLAYPSNALLLKTNNLSKGHLHSKVATREAYTLQSPSKPGHASRMERTEYRGSFLESAFLTDKVAVLKTSLTFLARKIAAREGTSTDQDEIIAHQYPQGRTTADGNVHE